MLDHDDLLLMLGKIDSKLEAMEKTQTAQAITSAKTLERVNKLEVSAAKSGAVSGLLTGSVISIGVAIISAQFKDVTGG